MSFSSPACPAPSSGHPASGHPASGRLASRARTLFVVLCLVLGPALGLWAGLPAGAAAQSTPSSPVTPVIAVADIARVLERARATQTIREQVTRMAASLSGKETELKQSLYRKQIDLERQRPVLSQQAFEEKARAVEKELQQAQRQLERQVAGLQAAEANAILKVQQSIEQIVHSIANRNGYNLVLLGQAVVIMDPVMDISEQVLQDLDKATPKVELVLPR